MKTRRSFLSAGAVALPAVFLPRRSKAVPVACGPACTIILVAIVLGIAIYILVKAIKGCEKMKKNYDKNHPNDDDNSVTPVTPPQSAREISPNLVHNAPAMDISDLGYTDPNGNLYCVASDIYVESADPAGSWQPEGKIETYVSFPNAAAMVWSDTYHCYPAIMAGVQPQGMKIKCYDRTGQLVSSRFTTFESGAADCGLSVISAITGGASKLFRLRSPVP